MRITNGKDRKLSANPGTLPEMSGALMSYFQKMRAKRLIHRTANFEAVKEETEENIDLNFMGVKQPFTPRQLAIKPEGMRAWKWFTIHSTPDFILEPNDEFILGDVETVVFTVMEIGDFREYGYMRYEVIEDYQP